MSFPLDSSRAASAARILLVAGLMLGGAACSHQQPVAIETVRPPSGHDARDGSPRPRSDADNLARNDGGVSAPSAPAIFFDFDSAALRAEDRAVLQQVADGFRARGDSRTKQLRIEGNCDDLGTTEYNLALGEHRARAARTYLVHLGVPDNHIATISYGSARPKYPDDSGRAKNRRDDLIMR